MVYDQLALSNGVIFLHTFEILDNKMKQGIINLQQGKKGIDGKAELDAALFVSVIVNGSLACELLLKSMTPTIKKEHHIDDLFSLLDSETKNAIEVLTVEKMKKTNVSYCSQDFYDDLTKNAKLFTEWRYFHECKGTLNANHPFISALAKSLFSVANNEDKK